MENSPTYNLDLAIERWRAEMAQSPALNEENLNELESHVRDLVLALHTKGLSEEEAFWIATKRVGTRPVLEKEFGKVNAQEVWMRRVLWMLIGVHVSRFIYMVSNSVHWTVLAGVYKFGHEYGFDLDGWAVLGSPIASLTAFVGVLWLCWRMFTRKGDAMMGWFEHRFGSRGKVLFGCFVLTLLWALVCIVSPLAQAWAMRNVPMGEMYRRFDQRALFMQVTYILEPLVLLGLTFYLALKHRRARRLADKF